ncbi:helix-turn-helix domain-containing protein [Streptomyces aureus]
MAEADGTAEFATLLRGLKERSGLSYGVLAKRLHMSTSTLHRYCNGDAVPVDYAPVERLARLCKAGSEELVELHRLWVLADAARRTKPVAAAEEPRRWRRRPFPTRSPCPPREAPRAAHCPARRRRGRRRGRGSRRVRRAPRRGRKR